MARLRKNQRKKRLGRLERYRARSPLARSAVALMRLTAFCRGGNPFGLGQWTRDAARPAGLASVES